ncbi:MAG: FtsX-like permease family protein [Bacteroidales bacterium]|nr:FtsX-like permease family protein [Bacteroidales bacterium]
MNLPLFIAKRYLFAKKSHNVINIISAISSIGMAIGTAALVIIMSVYNGFDSLVESMMGNIEPDLLITPATGKVFVPEGEVYDRLREDDAVASMCTVLEETVFIDYDGNQGVARAKGVDEVHEAASPIRAHIRLGEVSLHNGPRPMAVVGAGLAAKMEINPRFLSGINLYFPTRTGKISLTSPEESLNSTRVFPSATFTLNSEIDNSYIILPIDRMWDLLEYESGEISAVEIRLAEGAGRSELERVRKYVMEGLGEGFKVSDRYMQNESLYKMMKYEKAAIWLILIFVIIIIALNIFGSLSMLIIEKQGDIATLRSLGADDRLIRRIFVLEGWLISLLGMLAGLLIGIAFVALQSATGMIKMPGNFVVNSYPVILKPLDILVSITAISAIGYLIALIPSRKSRSGF